MMVVNIQRPGEGISIVIKNLEIEMWLSFFFFFFGFDFVLVPTLVVF